MSHITAALINSCETQIVNTTPTCYELSSKLCFGPRVNWLDVNLTRLPFGAEQLLILSPLPLEKGSHAAVRMNPRWAKTKTMS